MKKIKTKLIMFFCATLLVVSSILLVGLNRNVVNPNNEGNTSGNMAQPTTIDSSVWTGDIEAVYSKDFVVTESNKLTSLTTKTFYLSLYLKIHESMTSFTVEYKKPQSISGLTITPIRYNQDWIDEEDDNWETEMGYLPGGDDYKSTYEANAELKQFNTYGDYYSTPSGNECNAYVLFAGGIQYIQTSNTFGVNVKPDQNSKAYGVGTQVGKRPNLVTLTADCMVLIGKFKIELPSSANSFSAQTDHITLGVNGADNVKNITGNLLSTQYDLTPYDLALGAGQASNSTVVSGTIQGATESSSRAVSVDTGAGTITATLPAPDTTGNITLTVADSGTITSVTAVNGGSVASLSSGVAGAVSVNARGGTVTASVKVKAEDGTTEKTYALTITHQKYDEKRLTGITINSTIPGGEAPSYTFNAGSNDTSQVTTQVSILSSVQNVTIQPAFASDKYITVTVNSQQYTSNPITVSTSSQVNVVVTAEDGSSKTYVYQFSTRLFDEKRLTGITIGPVLPDTFTPSYSFNAGSNDTTQVTTQVSILASQSQVTVAPSFASDKGITVTVNGQSYSGSPITVPTSGPVTVVVRAEDGTEKTYVYNFRTIDTSIAANNGLKIEDTNGTTYAYTYSDATKTYTITNPLPYNVNQLKITVTLTDSTNNTLTINGTGATSGSPKNVTLSAGVQAISIPFVVSSRLVSHSDSYTIVGTRATGQTDNTIPSQSSAIVITSIDSVSAAQNNENITRTDTDITVQNTLAYTIDQLKITITMGSSFLGKVSINNVELTATTGGVYTYTYQIPVNTNPITNGTIPVVITSQTNVDHNYTIKYQREGANTNNLLQSVSGNVDGSPISGDNISFTPQSSTIIISGISESATTLALNAVPQESTSKVFINGSVADNQNANISLSFNGNHEMTFNIIVEAQSGARKTYTVTLRSDQYGTATGDLTIHAIVLTEAGSGTDYSQNFNAAGSPFTVNVPYSVTDMHIVVTFASTDASVSINFKKLASGNLTVLPNDSDFNLAAAGETTYVYVQINPLHGSGSGESCEIRIIRANPSDDATLQQVQIGDQNVPNPQPSTNPPAPGSSSPNSLPNPLPNGTTSVDVTPTPNDQNADYTVDGADNLQPGKNTVHVHVTPEDPDADEQDYYFDVYVDGDTTPDNIELDTYGLTPNYDPAVFSYNNTDEVPSNVNRVWITVTLSDPSQLLSGAVKIKFGNNDIPNGAGYYDLDAFSDTTVIPVVIKSYSSGSEKTYNITVKKHTDSDENKLLTISAYPNGGSPTAIDGFNPDNNAGITTYQVTYPNSVTNVYLTNLTWSANASISINPNTGSQPTSAQDIYSLAFGSSNSITVTITVTSESGIPNQYRFEFIRTNDEAQITNIRLLAQDGTTLVDSNSNSLVFNAATLSYSFTVPNTVSIVKFEVTKSIYATLAKDGTNISGSAGQAIVSEIYLNLGTGTTTITFKALSQLLVDTGSGTESDTYTISIERRSLDTDATLKELHITANGSELTLSPAFVASSATDLEYYIGNVDASQIFVAATPTLATSTITNGVGNIGLDGFLTSNYTYLHTITVRAEDGTQLTYKIHISRGAIDPSDDNSIMEIILRDSNGVDTYINFNADVTNYNVTLPAGITNYTILVSTLVGSYATISIDGTIRTTYQVAVDSTNWGTTNLHNVFARSQNGTNGQTYTINVEITAPSSDNTLTYLAVDDNVLINGADSGPQFNLSVTYETSSVTVVATVSDSTARIEVLSVSYSNSYQGVHNLVVGQNTIIVTVIAQNNESKQYVIIITRADKAPELLTLGVNGEVLLDENGRRAEFDPTVREYYVNVVYYHETADIFATSSNVTDIITGTGVKQLLVGRNECIVTVTNGSLSTTYRLHITRYPAESANANATLIQILEIPQFEEDFDTLKTVGYSYVVDNKLNKVTIVVRLENETGTADLGPATYEIYGDDPLHVGLNNVVVVVTAADGVTTKAYVVNITREPMVFEVAHDDYSVEATEEENVYNVNIGSTPSTEVDFKEFIKNPLPDSQNLEVTVLSNVEENPNEVVLSVTDGDEVVLVKLLVESTGNPTNVNIKSLIPLFIILGIILIILILILISVNKDKFGKITKKKDKKDDKKAKKEARK